MSAFSDKTSANNYSTFSVELLLPQPDDLKEITADFGILIGRVLVKHVPALKPLSSVVKQHIEHQYYKEMSSKSTMVSTMSMYLNYGDYNVEYSLILFHYIVDPTWNLSEERK